MEKDLNLAHFRFLERGIDKTNSGNWSSREKHHRSQNTQHKTIPAENTGQQARCQASQPVCIGIRIESAAMRRPESRQIGKIAKF